MRIQTLGEAEIASHIANRYLGTSFTHEKFLGEDLIDMLGAISPPNIAEAAMREIAKAVRQYRANTVNVFEAVNMPFDEMVREARAEREAVTGQSISSNPPIVCEPSHYAKHHMIGTYWYKVAQDSGWTNQYAKQRGNWYDLHSVEGFTDLSAEEQEENLREYVILYRMWQSVNYATGFILSL